MAFDEDLGYDGTQPIDQDYTLSALGLISRAFSLLIGNLANYIVIFGIISAACTVFSVIVYTALVGSLGMFVADPLGYLVTLFMTSTPQPITLVIVQLGFGFFVFLLNIIIAGAAIKYTLDVYGGGLNGNIGASFSHSLSRFVPFLIVQLLTSALAAIVLTPAVFLMDQAMSMIGPFDPLNPIISPEAIALMMQALLYFVVGGIILLYVQIRLAPTLPIVIDTDLSAIDSLKKSWELTSGNMLHIFGATILMGIAIFLISFMVGFATALTFLPVDFLTVLDTVIVTLLFAVVNFIFGVVLYRDLTSRQGGESNLPGYVM